MYQEISPEFERAVEEYIRTIREESDRDQQLQEAAANLNLDESMEVKDEDYEADAELESSFQEESDPEEAEPMDSV